jgi:hypothetical protein
MTVEKKWRDWLVEVLEWAKDVEHDAEALADYILETFAKGGVATPPDPTPDT